MPDPIANLYANWSPEMRRRFDELLAQEAGFFKAKKYFTGCDPYHTTDIVPFGWWGMSGRTVYQMVPASGGGYPWVCVRLDNKGSNHWISYPEYQRYCLQQWAKDRMHVQLPSKEMWLTLEEYNMMQAVREGRGAGWQDHMRASGRAADYADEVKKLAKYYSKGETALEKRLRLKKRKGRRGKGKK